MRVLSTNQNWGNILNEYLIIFIIIEATREMFQQFAIIWFMPYQ